MPSTPPRKTWLFVLAGVIPAVAIISLTVFSMSRAFRDFGKDDGGQKATEICADRLAKVAKAQFLYAAENDDRLPPAEHWIDATWKFGSAKDPKEVVESIFRCPTISMRREDGFGYAFNLDLDVKPLSEIVDRPGTPLVFDSKALFANAAGPPVAAYPAPEGRHNGGTRTNIAYADGRVGHRTGRP
ncbi:MAG TPA: hypothetical protein PLX06_02770 [Fimbriimonadaceae bacterium]|nr:hypothetical protein [Fimbriimonadaceae bacterium]